MEEKVCSFNEDAITCAYCSNSDLCNNDDEMALAFEAVTRLQCVLHEVNAADDVQSSTHDIQDQGEDSWRCHRFQPDILNCSTQSPIGRRSQKQTLGGACKKTFSSIISLAVPPGSYRMRGLVPRVHFRCRC